MIGVRLPTIVFFLCVKSRFSNGRNLDFLDIKQEERELWQIVENR